MRPAIQIAFPLPNEFTTMPGSLPGFAEGGSLQICAKCVPIAYPAFGATKGKVAVA